LRTVITGAGGFIGRSLVSAFAARGAEVVAVVRRAPREPLPVPWQVGELGHPLPAGALAGAERVIHLAQDMRPGYARLNVEGTKLWFEQAERARVPTQIYLSSCSAHPESPSEYGRAKFEVEAHVQARGGTVVRPGLVVGDGGLFGDMIAVSRRWPLLPVLGGNELRVFLTGLRELVALLAEPRDLAAGEIVNVFSPEPLPLKAVLDGIRQILGVRGVTLAVPVAMARPALSLASRLHPSARLYSESFLALVDSQGYGYQSSYPALGIEGRPLEAMLFDALGRSAGGR
jgi:uncharacterized protein YbjT (DUF2867 family)